MRVAVGLAFLLAVLPARADTWTHDFGGPNYEYPGAIRQTALRDRVEPRENRACTRLEVAEALGRIGEDRLRDVLGLEVVGRPAADVAKDLRIVAAERFLGAIGHPLHSRSTRRKVTVTAAPGFPF